MRRVVAASGIALVVLGFLVLVSFWLLWSFLPIVVGFVLFGEATVVWPRDGSRYEWKRRAAQYACLLLALAWLVLVRALFSLFLPRGTLGHLVADGVVPATTYFAYVWLRDRLVRRTTAASTS